MTQEAVLYRCQWGKNYRGVYVETHQTPADRPDPKWEWHKTHQEAKDAESNRMRRLASELAREADLLSRDERSRE
jgi:hypothetical protein